MDQTDRIQELEAELDKAAQEIHYLRERKLRLSLTNPTSRIHPDAPATLHFQVLLQGEPGTIDEEVTSAVRQGLNGFFQDREQMVREIEFLRSHLGPHLWADYERTIGMCGRQPVIQERATEREHPQCANHSCPLRTSCQRYTAIPATDRQGWVDFQWEIVNGEAICHAYVPMSEREDL